MFGSYSLFSRTAAVMISPSTAKNKSCERMAHLPPPVHKAYAQLILCRQFMADCVSPVPPSYILRTYPLMFFDLMLVILCRAGVRPTHTLQIFARSRRIRAKGGQMSFALTRVPLLMTMSRLPSSIFHLHTHTLNSYTSSYSYTVYS